MNQLVSIILAAGIPSTLTALIIGWFIKKQNEKEAAREEINVLLIEGVRAAISLGEASAIALRDGKTNGETKEALDYATKAKHGITNFLTRQTAKSIF